MPKSSAGQVLQPEGRNEAGQRRIRRLIVDLVSLAILTMLFKSVLVTAGAGDAGICARTGVTNAYQPHVSELSGALEAAASNSFGPGYENLGSMWAGYPDPTLVPASIPCVILKSIAFVESGWHQAEYRYWLYPGDIVPRGSSGFPVVSGSCGYGVMQITSPMTSYGQIPVEKQQRIASDFRYNVSYGAMMLVQKWNYPSNVVPPIGNNDPNVLEDWYYAVWAYNGMTDKNWPRNPKYAAGRPLFDGSQPWQNYPYQELVWGFAAKPPDIDGVRAWEPQRITLPDDSLINWPPRYVDDPQPTHPGTCVSSPPPPTPTPTATPVPIVRVSTTRMAFLTSEPGKSPNPQNLAVTGANSTPLTWSIPTVSGSWLSASPLSGTVPANVRITANTTALSEGRHTGTVTVKNTSINGQPDIVVDVSLYIGTLWKLRFPMISR